VPAPDPAGLRRTALYFNRELSWLAFNDRVLAQARDATHPLLERVKFLAINASNLDEFLMLRVSALVKQLGSQAAITAPARLEVERRLESIRLRARQMLQDQADVWDAIRELLDRAGISVLDPSRWTTPIRDHLAAYFAREIGPMLTPLAVEPGCALASNSNPSTHVIVAVRHAERIGLASVKVPDVLPRFVPLPITSDGAIRQTFVALEEVIRAHVDALFPGANVTGAHVCRVVRDAQLDIHRDGGTSVLETVDRSLRELVHGPVTLVQVGDDMPGEVLAAVKRGLGVTDAAVVRASNPAGFAGWVELSGTPRPDLKDVPWDPLSVWRPGESSTVVFDDLRRRDVVVHPPFESFDSVQAFLGAAARDPHVVAIKMTLYRIGKNTALMDLLVEAARCGKEVLAVVELRARRDERNNVEWTRHLQAHGVQVVHGFEDHKTHAKLCMVVRQESDGIRRYVHASSGNYNTVTAGTYTDVALFTSDPDIANDVATIFNHLTGHLPCVTLNGMLAGPKRVRPALRRLIRREAAHARAGRAAHIIIKVNGLTDSRTIRDLYRASRAGVSIDLLVRGTCRLRPGLPGISDNIRVRSIVGRFLEHSRIYWFHNDGKGELHIGSADLMERNLDRRVEALVPVRDPAARAYLRHVVLDAYLRDTSRAFVLDSTGRYRRPEASSGPFDAQQFLVEQYATRRHQA